MLEIENKHKKVWKWKQSQSKYMNNMSNEWVEHLDEKRKGEKQSPDEV